MRAEAKIQMEHKSSSRLLACSRGPGTIDRGVTLGDLCDFVWKLREAGRPWDQEIVLTPGALVAPWDAE